MKAGRDARARGTWQGMNWVRQDLRLAIMLRDRLACAWCGDSLENGAQLSLDHVIPHSLGGTNKAKNLVCACRRCNSSRGNRSVEVFAEAVAAYVNHGVTAQDITSYIAETTQRDIKAYRKQAKEMIASRGSAARVLAAL